MSDTLAWIIAWVLTIVLFYALATFEAGKRLIYYGLWLLILLLIVTHYQEIASIFTQGNITQGEVSF